MVRHFSLSFKKKTKLMLPLSSFLIAFQRNTRDLPAACPPTTRVVSAPAEYNFSTIELHWAQRKVPQLKVTLEEIYTEEENPFKFCVRGWQVQNKAAKSMWHLLTRIYKELVHLWSWRWMKFLFFSLGELTSPCASACGISGNHLTCLAHTLTCDG